MMSNHLMAHRNDENQYCPTHTDGGFLDKATTLCYYISTEPPNPGALGMAALFYEKIALTWKKIYSYTPHQKRSSDQFINKSIP
jgi:hypothetical protein